MTEDLSLPSEDRTTERVSAPPTDLVAVPDDPEDVSEVTIHPEDVSADRQATAWITVDVADLLDLRETR